VLQKVDTTHVPLSAFLGAVGMPGVTAWYGLVRIIDPKAGETIVVSSAAGAVGGAVGQLAKARGCRVVGIAGGPAKCRHVVEDLGFDACIDYREHGDLKAMSAALKAACPEGIDGHFENVGGMILDAVLLRANAHARVALCGMIAGYNGEPIPMAMPQLLLTNRMKLQGFIVTEHMDAWPEALKELGTLVATGRLKYREDIAQGPRERARRVLRAAQGPQQRQAARQARLRGRSMLNWQWCRFERPVGRRRLRHARAALARVRPGAGLRLPRSRTASTATRGTCSGATRTACCAPTCAVSTPGRKYAGALDRPRRHRPGCPQGPASATSSSPEGLRAARSVWPGAANRIGRPGAPASASTPPRLRRRLAISTSRTTSRTSRWRGRGNDERHARSLEPGAGLADTNLFEADLALRDAVRFNAPALDAAGAARAGRGGGQRRHAIPRAPGQPHAPRLHTHDRTGHRVDEVGSTRATTCCSAPALRHRLHGAPWAPQGPSHVERAAGFLMFTELEPSVLCPVSMTYAVTPALRANPALQAAFGGLLASPVYDERFGPASAKTAVTMGMGMTEKQGGSDVRANTTQAVRDGGDAWGERYRLIGHKWFMSAPMSDAFLVVAQTPAGPTCFFLPRWLPDGTLNAVRIQRLKDKLGNKANASSEVEFVEAMAWRVGDEGRGLPQILAMGALTRLDCALGTAGLMRGALALALHHARHRQAFGRGSWSTP
jgi:hypothetical protein